MVFRGPSGPEIEDLMGRVRSRFYLLGGLAASTGGRSRPPELDGPELGASGAIASVMGAFLVTYSARQNALALVIVICANG